jgi:hypothetical protein
LSSVADCMLSMPPEMIDRKMPAILSNASLLSEVVAGAEVQDASVWTHSRKNDRTA